MPPYAHTATSISYANLFFAKEEFNHDAGMVHSLVDLLPRLLHNLYAYGHGIATLCFPALLPTGDNLIAAAIVVPLLIGFVWMLWCGRGVVEIYTGLLRASPCSYTRPQWHHVTCYHSFPFSSSTLSGAWRCSPASCTSSLPPQPLPGLLWRSWPPISSPLLLPVPKRSRGDGGLSGAGSLVQGPGGRREHRDVAQAQLVLPLDRP